MKDGQRMNLAKLRRVNVTSLESKVIRKNKKVTYSRTKPRPRTTISFVK